MKSSILSTLATAAALTAFSAHADVVQNNYSDPTTMVGFAASSTDLINSGTLTLLGSPVISGYSNPYGFPVSALNDGTVGTNDDTVQTDGAYNNSDGTANQTYTATFNLDLSSNTNGYTINQINTIAGWVGNATDQKYMITYTTATDSTPQTLGTFIYGAPDAAIANQNENSTEISLTSDSGPLLTNVASIEFTIYTPDLSDDDFTVMREIDVIGAPTEAPEPSTWALFGASVLGFAMLGRRRLFQS